MPCRPRLGLPPAYSEITNEPGFMTIIADNHAEVP
jgi:hypothetical protein